MTQTKRRHWFRVCLGQVALSLRHRRSRHAATLLSIAAACVLWTVLRLRLQNPALTGPDWVRLQWYATASLVLCAFGISQSILLSVAERTKEIGTLKCLGASSGFVVVYVLVESMAIAIMGTALGYGIGVLVFWVATPHPQANWLVAAMETALVGLGATLVAAVPPAWQAGAIPSVAALRSEV